MRVLLTATQVATWSGADLYAVEVAQGLAGRGHDVVVHAVISGPLADDVQRRGVRVVQRQPRGSWVPDVIHAQGSIGARAALANYPGVPILFVCHGHDSWNEFMPSHPSIRRYAGVSQVCTDALRRHGSPPERTALLPNYVDTDVFTRRSPLPPQPKRALMFSNYAKAGGYLEAVAAACARLGVQLDHAGAGTGTATRAPYELLPGYDVVFAKGRAAIEALAVGCAVVLCDFAGVGPLVTTADFDRLRQANFGFAALTRPHDVDVLVSELRRYDSHDAGLVCDRIRSEAALTAYLDELESTYQLIIDEAAALPAPQPPGQQERAWLGALTFALRIYRRLPTERRLQLRPRVAALMRAR
jgi:hypothetical protein